MNIEHIKYTIAHKKQFLVTEKELLGYNTIHGYLHDVDKILMYLFTGKKHEKAISKFHRKHSSHHAENTKIKKRMDYIQMIIDWECSRYTKPDKQLTPRQVLSECFPELKK
jgi:hypothetical protein